jgi:hypothetical protein
MYLNMLLVNYVLVLYIDTLQFAVLKQFIPSHTQNPKYAVVWLSSHETANFATCFFLSTWKTTSLASVLNTRQILENTR